MSQRPPSHPPPAPAAASTGRPDTPSSPSSPWSMEEVLQSRSSTPATGAIDEATLPPPPSGEFDVMAGGAASDSQDSAAWLELDDLIEPDSATTERPPPAHPLLHKLQRISRMSDDVEVATREYDLGNDTSLSAMLDALKAQQESVAATSPPAAAPAAGPTRPPVGGPSRPPPVPSDKGPAATASSVSQPAAARTVPPTVRGERPRPERGNQPQTAPARLSDPVFELSRVRKTMPRPSLRAAKAMAPRPRPSWGPRRSQSAQWLGRDDRGADVALRTVRERKNRAEHLALVGSTRAATERRIALLEALAANATQRSAKARLLVAAAELAERLSLTVQAERFYTLAHDSDPRDVMALRGLRRLAGAQGQWPRVAELLDLESAQPLADAERSLVFCALAQVQLQRLHNPHAAQRAALAAVRLQPEAPGAALMLAFTMFASGSENEALQACERAATTWQDPAGRSALFRWVGRIWERRGRNERAASAYRNAALACPDSFDARLGWARATLTTEGFAAATPILAALRPHAAAASVLDRSLAGVQERVAARGGSPAAARLAMLPTGHPDVLTLRAQALACLEAYRAGGDDAPAAAQVQSAMQAWIAHSHGALRALAHLTHARALLQAGDAGAAADAWRAALQADGDAGHDAVLAAQMQQALSQPGARTALHQDEGRGDGRELWHAVADLSTDAQAASLELELLAQAVELPEHASCAALLLADLAACRGERHAFAVALQHIAAHGSQGERLGAWLTLALLAVADGQSEAQRQALAQAFALAPDEPVATQAYARALTRHDRQEAGRLWLHLAQRSRGSWAAFAATEAASLLADAPAEIAAYHEALAHQRAYPPAYWRLRELHLLRRECEALHRLDIAAFAALPDKDEARGRLAQVLLDAPADMPSEQRWTLNDALAQARPDDPLWLHLALRWRRDVSAAQFARLVQQRMSALPQGLQCSATIWVAQALEGEGRLAQAATLYRACTPPPALQALVDTALWRTELGAGQGSKVEARLQAWLQQDQSLQVQLPLREHLANLASDVLHHPAAARAHWHAVLELDAASIPAWCALEADAMERGGLSTLVRSASAFATHSPDARSAAAHARLAFVLQKEADRGHMQGADAWVMQAASTLYADPWLLRRLVGAAWAAGDAAQLAAAYHSLVHASHDVGERTAFALRTVQALWCGEGAVAALEGAQQMQGQLRADYPGWMSTVAALEAATGAPMAAYRSHRAAYGAALSPRARILFAEQAAAAALQAQDTVAAIDALQRVVTEDITAGDACLRLAALLEAEGDDDALAALVEARLAAGGSPAQLAPWHVRRAQGTAHTPSTAIRALQAALTAGPGLDSDTLQRLCAVAQRLCAWPQLSQAYSLWLAQKPAPDLQQHLLWQQAQLQAEVMAAPDAAIESLTTLLAQAPDHTEARTALIDLYLQTAQPDHAAAWLERWQSEANDWSTERDIRLRWAQVMEQRGDRQQAESMLTALQRESPTHLPLIEALAAFYRRQHASVALSALVDRASEDLRQAVVRGPADAALWQGQIRFLAAEGRAERAQVMAAAATALGIDLPTQAALCGPEGTLPGARQRALDAVLDPQLFPPSVSPALRQLLRLTTRAFERAIPFDLKALQATLVRGAGDLLADELQTLRQWLPEQDIEVWSTSVLPDACLPLAARPLRLLLGTSLRQHPEPAVRLFALLRGAACARAGLAVALYSAEDDLAHTVASLIHHHCPTFVPAGMQPGSLAPLGKKLRRWLERRDRAEVAEAAAACAADPNFQVQHIGVGVRDYANRVALLATGNLAAGLHTLLHIARVPVPNALPGRVDAMRQSPEAWSLFNFACSDAYIEARRHAAPPPPPSVATVTEGR